MIRLFIIDTSHLRKYETFCAVPYVHIYNSVYVYIYILYIYIHLYIYIYTYTSMPPLFYNSVIPECMDNLWMYTYVDAIRNKYIFFISNLDYVVEANK
jgi:hypothetical protein